MNFPGIRTAEIYLPKEGTDLQKWAVIACDQFTSEPAYWNRVKETVGDAPSTLFLIQPEAFLSEACPEKINEKMAEYLSSGTVTPAVKDGFLLVERTTENGVRLGLMAALDLECYDYTTGKLLTRATEDTVPDRLPPRVKIRENAPMELPHVLVLIDDPQKTVIEPLYVAASRKDTEPESPELLYDFDLMEDGGHLRGWKIEDPETLRSLGKALSGLEKVSGGFLYAVGDGNHSLATAKKCWENLKATLSEEQAAVHPARYALVELENLHQESLLFEPIHRVLFHAAPKEVIASFDASLKRNGMSLSEAGKERKPEVTFTDGTADRGFVIEGRGEKLPVALVQEFLDTYLKEHSETAIDYIHGEESVKKLSKEGKNTGILLEGIPKDSFFAGIRAGGHLPRKTFSMGVAKEKRYYMELRKIR